MTTVCRGSTLLISVFTIPSDPKPCKSYTSSVVIMALKIEIMVIYTKTSCNLVGWYQHFGGIWCFCHQGYVNQGMWWVTKSWYKRCGSQSTGVANHSPI